MIILYFKQFDHLLIWIEHAIVYKTQNYENGIRKMLLLNLFLLKLTRCYYCVPDMKKEVVIKSRFSSLVLNADAEIVYRTQHKSSETEKTMWQDMGPRNGVESLWVSDVVRAGIWAKDREEGPRKTSIVQLLFFHYFEKWISFLALFLEVVILALAISLCACYSGARPSSALWSPYSWYHKFWWYLT